MQLPFRFSLPARFRDRTRVAVDLLEAPEEVRRLWDATVQRSIDLQDVRIDDASRGWRWSSASWRTWLATAFRPESRTPPSGLIAAAAKLAAATGQKPIFLAVADAETQYPFAMCLVCDNFEDAHFFWMISAPGSDVVRRHFDGGAVPGQVGLGTLWALARRAVEQQPPQGVLLHAAPGGKLRDGRDILDWYRKDVGMTQLAQDEWISPARSNDGRYLRLSPSGAQAFVTRHEKDFLP